MKDEFNIEMSICDIATSYLFDFQNLSFMKISTSVDVNKNREEISMSLFRQGKKLELSSKTFILGFMRSYMSQSFVQMKNLL